MIEVNNISKIFELTKKQRKENNTSECEAVAVKDVTFSCQSGRVFSLLGPNGAGKTTTLRMIARLLAPTKGTIVVNGFDTIKNPEQARRSMGFLTGSTGLYG
jgi:sodium transport system ATP-binding protein